jgi:hypothetical protein
MAAIWSATKTLDIGDEISIPSLAAITPLSRRITLNGRNFHDD